MTSTSVKDAGNVLSGIKSSFASRASAVSNVSFQNVLSSQTSADSQAGAAQTGKVSERRQLEKPGESLKTRDSGKVTDRTMSDTKETDQVSEEEPSGQDVENPESLEKLESLMEILGTAAGALIDRIADTFDISVEEVQDLAGEMGLVPADLLDREVLSGFLLKAAGVEEPMALLTDETLYQNFKQVTGELDTMLSQEDVEGSGMNLEELKNFLPQTAAAETVSTKVVEADEEENKAVPVTITVESTGEEADNAVTREGQTLGMKDLLERTGREASDEHQMGRGSRERSNTQEQGMNLFQQNLNVENPNLQAAQVSGASSSWNAETQDIMQQIMDYMKIQVKPDMSNLEMQLHPAHLGTLQISVAAKGGIVTANFVAQNEAVKAALESQMVQLKESFAEQGVKVEAIEVTVQTHQFEQNLEQGQNRGQSGQEKRSGNRRIRLDGPVTMEELDNMEGEDRLAVQMMEANGNTVDFTA